MGAANAYNRSLLPTKNENSKPTTNAVNNIKKGMNAAFARLSALVNSINSTPKNSAQQGGKRKTRTKHHGKRHGTHRGKRHVKHRHTRRNKH